MNSSEIRQKFLDFFKERGHAIVSSSSLVPDDPSVLLTTAGMQQFKKYFTSELDSVSDFGSKNTTSIQKSFRTSDIDEVGDVSHLTFFEMLGNFSFGGYFKKEAIQYGHDFIKDVMGLTIDYVSVFKGDNEVPADIESEEIWKLLGVTNIQKFGREDNFWGPTGSEGPCGPTTEIYVKNSEGKSIEIWNIVFNEYYMNPDKSLRKLDTPGVDTGMGLERLAMVSQNVGNVFETDLFKIPFGFKTVKISGVDVRYKRIFADHLRASVFLIADGVRPLNKDAGYILRRLIRRTVVSSRKMGFSPSDSETTFLSSLDKAIDYYGDFYKDLFTNKELIKQVWFEEKNKFEKTLELGLKEFEIRYPAFRTQTLKPGEPYKIPVPQNISGKDAFDLHQSYGFTIDVLRDLASEGGHKIDEKSFEEEFKKHQEISRAGSVAKFGGHGLYLKTGEVTIRDESEVEKVTRYHTATHLMHSGLRAILGEEVRQDGSDITVLRTRFDFRFPRKVASEELKKVEEWVNNAIKKDLTVKWEEMSFEEATKEGALGFFREKYPVRVKVYTVYDQKTQEVYSKELCGGPHVTHTGEIGEFKITKEEAVGAGVRRIRGVITS
jgi:alanyl-tRNA synthetase